MRIRSITLTWVRVPLVEPFRISSGSVAEKDAIVVRVESDGFSGWGESSPMAGSFYSTDTPESCWSELCDVIVPAVLHRDLSAGDELPGKHFASVGIETALWDIDAQRRGVPLHKLLGGTRDCVEAGLAVGLYEDTSQLLRTTERHLAAGYKRVKIKIARGSDVELVHAMRGAFGDDLPLMVDANGDYTLEHIDVFRRLDEFNLMMIEQPLAGPMLEESAELQRQLRTPICLDESLEDLAAAERAIALGSLRIANIKIQRVGGFRNALRMYRSLPRTPTGRLDRDDAGTRHRTGTGRGALVAPGLHVSYRCGGKRALVLRRHHRPVARGPQRYDRDARGAGTWIPRRRGQARALQGPGKDVRQVRAYSAAIYFGANRHRTRNR